MSHFHVRRAHPAESLTYIQSEGRSIALSVWKRHEKATTVLFYPGTMASPWLYPVLLESLWRHGCNVVGLHPLSHGASQRSKKAFVLDDVLQNGCDAAAWIRENFDGPLAVSGHSQGGILSVAHAARLGGVDVALPICTLLPQHPKAGLVTRFRKHLQQKETLLKVLSLLSRFTPRLPLTFFMYLELARITAGARSICAPRTHTRVTYPASFIHSLFAADLSCACQKGHITAPVFLFNAVDDALFPLWLMREMLDCIEAPQKGLVPIAGGGHMVAMSTVYAPQIAARMAGICAGLGFALYANEYK